MTNTSSPASRTYDAILEQAAALGAEHGHAAGTWVIVDEDDNARALLKMDEEGDPEFDDASGYRAPLSGEWADDLTPGMLRVSLDVDEATWLGDDQLSDAACTSYELAHRDAFVAEVLRMARAQLED